MTGYNPLSSILELFSSLLLYRGMKKPIYFKNTVQDEHDPRLIPTNRSQPSL